MRFRPTGQPYAHASQMQAATMTMAAEQRRVDLLTPSAAAAYVGVSYSTLYRATKAGHIPVIHLGPQVVRYAREDLDRWIEESRG